MRVRDSVGRINAEKLTVLMPNGARDRKKYADRRASRGAGRNDRFCACNFGDARTVVRFDA